MRNYAEELEARAGFISRVIKDAGASGVVFGNSGGKDSALVGILCKKACGNTLGLIMPCESRRNYNEDTEHARLLSEKFDIAARACPLTAVKESLAVQLGRVTELSSMASANINPRLRMAALYAVAASENMLVAGTGNASEGFLGYFTKWGDGAYDFNPIADLTVTEIFEFLRFLGAPGEIINKAPSAALFEEQTDEAELGVTYAQVDAYLRGEEVSGRDKEIIERLNKASAHKRKPAPIYGN